MGKLETSSSMRSDAVAELPLPGGRLTKGVVLVGETVRRPAGPRSEFLAALLRHFEQLGVDCVPRYLGQDEQGRDMLSFIAGHVPRRWGYFSDAQVAAAARLLRVFHDATRSCELRAASSVICHNDLSPSNAVFVNEQPVAIIDFDMAEPGEPLEDLGYSAWAWCISSKPERPPVLEQARQVRVLCDAYGGLTLADRSSLVDAVLQRLERNACFWLAALESDADLVTPANKRLEMVEWSRDQSHFVEMNREHFEQALRE